MRRLVTMLLVIPLLGALAAPVAAESPTTTEAPTTSVRTDLLPGVALTVEEVEPGVFRVVSDGVRDLVLGANTDILAGQDGSIWLVNDVPGGPVSPISRLGSDKSFQLPEGWDTRIVVAPDGTVWVSRTRGRPEDREVNRIHSLDNGKWTRRLKVPAFGGPHGLTVGPDGAIWTTRPAAGEKEGVVVTRLGPDGWQQLKKRAPGQGDLFVTESGEVWLVGSVGRTLMREDDGAWRELGGNGLWRYREGAGGWEEVMVDATTITPFGNPVEVGSDGTVWLAGVEPLLVDGEPVPDEDAAWSPKPGDPFLMRFDGIEWQRWGPADGVPTLGIGWGEADLAQDPDGALWMTAPLWTLEGVLLPCSEHWGVAHFDASEWRHLLSGHCVSEMEAAPDGSVWLKARGSDTAPWDLYVITTEAAAAAG